MVGGEAPLVRSTAATLNNSSAAVAAAATYNGFGNTSLALYSHSDALLQGLNALRCSDKLFDVTLIVEGRTFKAHRVVLAACSDYFCAMFTDAMRESRQAEIKLNGVTAKGIELLLEYAYTAKLKLDRYNVEDVLAVSTHVQMKAVIDACSNFLESQIDLENCVAIASLADLYALDLLKQKSYRYLCSRLDEFSQTSDLLTLNWDQLESILADNYPVDCSEKRVLQIALKYCLNTRLSPDLARRIFAEIRFNQVDSCSLNAMINNATTAENSDGSEEEANDVTVKTRLGAKYRQLIREEMLRQELKRKRQAEGDVAGVGAIDELIPPDVLINSRGMELALVKIGGFETNGLTNQISCYLPSKGKWESLTVIPHIEQCNYGTAVLGNDLYIVGGSYDVCLKEYIHPFGFHYCPTKNKWKTIAPIQADRCRFSLNAMGGNFLYAVGGVYELNDNDGEWAYDAAISNCERYNAKLDRWEYMPPLSENRSQHAGVVIGDLLYISGGIDRHMVLASFWCFDTKTEKWSKLCPMPTPRADHVLISYEGRIYACSGWYEDPRSESRELADSIDVYDVDTDQWTTESNNAMSKFYPGVTLVNRKIYFIGGLHSTASINRATSAVQYYDLETKQWSFNSEWEYPKEVWECTLAAFYVPRDRDDDIKYYWGEP